MRPTWVEVSLPALRRNFRTVQGHVAPATVCAVVKADAYGHGAVDCALALESEGAQWLGVTSTEEGAQLRNAGVAARILVLTGFWRGEEDEILKYDLTPAVSESWHFELLEAAAARMSGRSRPVPVHLKLNTGMARLGLDVEALPTFLKTVTSARHVQLEGIFTHLASAEVVDAPDVERQLSRFEEAVSFVNRSGLTPAYFHAVNSAGIITRKDSWKNMVRPGLLLYGYCLPCTSYGTGALDTARCLPVEPILTWKTRITSLRSIQAGQAVGYGGSYVAKAPATLASIPVGYADGLNRQLSSRGHVIVRNSYAAMVGNISMDITMIDVTGIPGASVGDEVILIGSCGQCSIGAWEQAIHARTIPYEILCAISKRVPRIYIE